MGRFGETSVEILLEILQKPSTFVSAKEAMSDRLSFNQVRLISLLFSSTQFRWFAHQQQKQVGRSF
jgi:hypothetical protein